MAISNAVSLNTRCSSFSWPGGLVKQLSVLMIVMTVVGMKAQAMGLLPDSKQVVPNADAITSWQEIPGYRDSQVDSLTVARVALDCGDKNLYPTHPQQNTKLYHLFLSARYDHTRLKGDDEACATSAKYSNAQGAKACLRPDYLEYAVISDIYRDSCGHTYRGFFDVAFLKANDNMGVLFAKGRALYPKPNAGALMDMYVGDTYAVDQSEFLFLSPLFPGDQERSDELQTSAAKSHILQNNIWRVK